MLPAGIILAEIVKCRLNQPHERYFSFLELLFAHSDVECRERFPSEGGSWRFLFPAMSVSMPYYSFKFQGLSGPLFCVIVSRAWRPLPLLHLMGRIKGGMPHFVFPRSTPLAPVCNQVLRPYSCAVRLRSLAILTLHASASCPIC